jgi:hypothetical protein
MPAPRWLRSSARSVLDAKRQSIARAQASGDGLPHGEGFMLEWAYIEMPFARI